MENLKSHVDVSKISGLNASILNESRKGNDSPDIQGLKKKRINSLMDTRTAEEKEEGFLGYLDLIKRNKLSENISAKESLKKKRVSILVENIKPIMPIVNEIGDENARYE